MKNTFASSSDGYPSRRAGWYAVLLLTSAYTFSFIDRQIVNLLVDPIRNDLNLSDTQVSFLQGLAFVLPYVLLSIPLGRVADVARRTRVLVIGIVCWSVACVGCGLSRNMWQLALARVGVGAGEASVTPASWSLLADYFPASERALPVSIFLMGPYLGAGLSLILGAEVIAWAETVGDLSLPLIGVLEPWQFTFMAVAIPGLCMAMLLPTLREPARKERLGTSQQALPWSQAWHYLKTHRELYGAFLLGAPFIIIVLYALQAWVPSLMVRVHGLAIAEAGRSYGVIALLAGSLGVVSGPVIARYLQRQGCKDAPLRVGVFAAGLLLPVVVFAGLADDATLALALVALASYLVTVPLALFAAGLQSVTPNELRGLVAGLYVLTTNLLGLALGPTSVALASDYVFGDARAVGKSLALVAVVSLPIAMWLLASGMRAYRATELQGLEAGKG